MNKISRYNLKLVFHVLLYLCVYICGFAWSLLFKWMDWHDTEDKLVGYSICGFHELNSGFQYSASNKSPHPEPSWWPTTIFDPIFSLVKESICISSSYQILSPSDNILGAGLVGLHHHIWLLKRIFSWLLNYKIKKIWWHLEVQTTVINVSYNLFSISV